MNLAKEWDAASYQRLSGPQFAWGQKVLARIALRGDETALDVGCGTGRLTAELAARLPQGRVLALDASEQMIAEATKNLAPRFGERVTFARADALDVGSLGRDGDFDLVFSTATFHWILDHPRLFAALLRVLRPGGRLVAQCGGEGNLARFHDVTERAQAKEPFARYFAAWPSVWEFASAETTKRRLVEAGFTDVETSLEDAPTPFANAEEFASFIRTVVLRPHLAHLPDDALRAEFLACVVAEVEAEVVAEVEAEAGTGETPYSLDYKRLNLEARRPA